jgi:hypothetical protein
MAPGVADNHLSIPSTAYELWRIDRTRCVLDRHDERASFAVDLYEGNTLISHREFPDHDAATLYAVDALRAFVPAE